MDTTTPAEGLATQQADPCAIRPTRAVGRSWRLGIGALAAMALLGVWHPTPSRAEPDAQRPTMPHADALTGPLTVDRVVDGDTLWVTPTAGPSIKVRLIGVDTPELLDPRSPVECFAREASAYAKKTLTGQQVYLQNDPSQDSADRYGRRLAYVWTAHGQLFNLDLIAEGYATEYTYATHYQYRDVFRSAQTDAANADRGLWSPQTCSGRR